MGRIHLLHISDLHISKTPYLQSLKEIPINEVAERIWDHEILASYDPGILRSLTKFVSKHHKNLQALIVTGDIATSGLTHDLQRALNVVNKFKEYLPVFLLPGNHDRYQDVTEGMQLMYKPGDKKFYVYFKNYWNDAFLKNFWDDDVKKNLYLENDDLAVCVISADFSLRRTRNAELLGVKGGFYAQGFVYDDTLKRLEEATQKAFKDLAKKKNVAIIWALHFPSFAFGIPNHSKLINAKKLVDAARENKVLAVVSGHMHYKIKEHKDGVFFFGAGSACQVDGKGNHIQILTINNDDGILSIDEEDFIYNPNQSRFVKYGQRF